MSAQAPSLGYTTDLAAHLTDKLYCAISIHTCMSLSWHDSLHECYSGMSYFHSVTCCQEMSDVAMVV